MNASELKNFLQIARIEQKISCRALAEIAKVHHRTVQNFFDRNRKNIHVDIMINIIHALGFEVEMKVLKK